MDLLTSWKSYLSSRKINEMHWIVRQIIPDDLFHSLPSYVQEQISRVDVLDLSLEKYKQIPHRFPNFDISKLYKNNSIVDKVIIPAGNKLYLYDDKTEEFTAPTKEQLSKLKEIPILPKNWYEAYLYRIDLLDDYLKQKSINEKAELIKKDLSQIKSLAVFDFDKTLFKSPDAPEGYKGNWHIKIDSLTPPAVEQEPQEDMWFMKVVEKAKELYPIPTVYCIMLTGRVDTIFEDRIKELLSQRGLKFDLIKLNEFGGDTVEYKTATINQLIKKMPKLKSLEMWEDKEDQANKFKESFGHGPYSFKINMIDDSYSKSNINPALKIKIK